MLWNLHIAALAWAHLSDPKQPELNRARDLLAAALTANRCDRALYVSGVTFRARGEEDLARARFEEALRINPKNADALAPRCLRRPVSVPC